MLDTNEIQLIKRLKSKPRLGMADDYLDKIQDQLKDIFDGYKAASGDILREGAFKILAESAQNLYAKLNVLETRNLAVQSGFKTSTKRAAELGYQFDKLAISAGNAFNSEKLKGYLVNLNKVFVGNTKLFKAGNESGEAIAKQVNALQNKLKLTDEQANNFIKFQLNAGKVAKRGDITKSITDTQQAIADVAKAMGGEDGYESALTAITSGIGDLGAATNATFGRIPKDLALAVLKSNKLGLSLEKITGIGKGFLDIEQAIGSEIEFQILSGKELLTTDKKSLTSEFQKAALAQDANKQAELYADFLKNFGEDLQNDPLLQEQAAGMFNLSADDLFDSLATYRASIADAIDPAAAFQEIFKKTSTDIGKSVDSFDKLADAESQQTQTDRLKDDAQIAKNREIIGANPEGYANKVVELMDLSKNYQDGLLKFSANITSELGNSEFMKNLAGAGGIAVAIKALYESVKSYTPGDYEGSQVALDVKDIFIPAGDNNVITGPLGSFSLDPKDDILAMPNAREALANQGSTTPNNTTPGGTDTAALVAALQGMSFHVTNTFDGDKIQSQLTIRQGQRLNA